MALALGACSATPETGLPARSDAFLQSYHHGLDLLERFRLAEAEAAFARCVQLAPEAHEGHWQLGRLQLLQGRLPEGLQTLRHTLELQPDLEEVRQLILETYLGRGREALEEGHFVRARDYFAQALETHPHEYAPLYQAAITALWLQDWATADSLFRRTVDHHPDALEARWHLTWLDRDYQQQALDPGYRFPDQIPLAPGPKGGFVEIGADAGVAKVDGGRASAWADYDDDGDLDLAVIGHPGLAYYRNDGSGFSERTQQSGLSLPPGGIGIQTADYDNDGAADLYITRDGWFGGAPNVLYRNSGDGTFTDRTDQSGTQAPGSSFCAAWADYDRDGWLDLYVANGTGATGDSTNVLYRNRGDGTFADQAPRAGVAHKGQSLSAAWGDYDNDGAADLYVCNFTETNALYRNKGDGTFADVTRYSGTGAGHVDGFITFFFDYDNDGQLDLFVGNWSTFDAVLQNRAEGRPPSPRDRPVLYRNQGDGTFADITQQAGLARALGTMSGVPADIDNDGHVDLYLGNGGPRMGRREPDTLYRNQGDGTFADITQQVGLGHMGKSHGVTFADFDRDGDLDLYTPVGGAQPGDQWANAFYRNEGFGNHWIVLRLQGNQSNRDGIGARVRLQSGDLVQYAEVASGYSFGCSSSLELEFGLGPRTQVDEIEIRWPSGQTDRYRNLSADRFLRLTEGAPRPQTLP
ncbi:MAG: hypothetical protein GKR89_05490 [Candidatus Latescibacteria bacterium]|nr:hypothetical protein [Candidatus Latescibacterota bacterium]